MIEFALGIICGAALTLVSGGLVLIGAWLWALTSGEWFIPR